MTPRSGWYAFTSPRRTFFLSLRANFLFRTDSGYPKNTGVNKYLQPLGIPFAITSIVHLHQSPPSPIPGDQVHGKRRAFPPRTTRSESESIRIFHGITAFPQKFGFRKGKLNPKKMEKKVIGETIYVSPNTLDCFTKHQKMLCIKKCCTLKNVV